MSTLMIAFIAVNVVTMWLLILHVSALRSRLDAQAKVLDSLSRLCVVQFENAKFHRQGMSRDIGGIAQVLGVDDQ